MRLTVGMRAKFKKDTAESYTWSDCAGYECLLEERSGKSFSVMILGQKELKKEDPKTVLNQVAWVNEEDLEFVDDDFRTNLDFIDWYQEHEEDFCPDCGAWFPGNGLEDAQCPNEKCPGRLYDQGLCPYCEVKEVDGVCPECGFEFNL